MDSRLIKMASEAGILFPTILPLFCSPPKKEAVEQWIERHSFDPALQQIASKLADNINYISFEIFLGQLKKSIKAFNKAVLEEPFVIWTALDGYSLLSRTTSHGSNLWVLGLAFEYCGLRQPEAILNTEQLTEYLFQHPKIKHIVTLDDACYRGSQIQVAMSSYNRELYTKEPSNPDIVLNDVILHICIPFMSIEATKRISSSSFHTKKSCVVLYNQMQIRKIDEILNQDDLRYFEKIDRVISVFTLTYFDHRYPDGNSTLQNFLYGSLLVDDIKNSTKGQNPVMPLVPTVIPPYRLDDKYYLKTLQKALASESLGMQTIHPVPERYQDAIKMLEDAGMNIEITKSKPKLLTTDFKQAIANYIAYKDKFCLRWLASSETSLQAAKRMKHANDDAERFSIAKEYVDANPNKQLAKNLVECMPELKM